MGLTLFVDNLSLPLLPVPVYFVGRVGQTAPCTKPYLRCWFQDGKTHSTSVMKQTFSNRDLAYNTFMGEPLQCYFSFFKKIICFLSSTRQS